MSRLRETQRAYGLLAQLLDQEIRKRSSSTKDLERFRKTLDSAFYLLGWAQFEYLVRKEAETIINDKAKAKTIERHAWRYLKENMKNISVKNRLDLVFDNNPAERSKLEKRYEVRNQVAHDYEELPSDAKDISEWLNKLENLVEQF